jgi:hypothetical protein
MDEAFAAVEAAFDLLDSAEVLHTFDDSVTLRVDRELWEAFLNQGA